jgi:glutamate racemase
VSRIQEVLPNERIVYFGDTARLPYGSKSRDTVTRFSREIARFLVRRDVKALVVACNTASSLALPTLAQELPIDVLGVIEPGASAALARTHNGHIGVIGTVATVRSGAYAEALRARRAGVHVVQVATPLFVHLVEEGWVSGDIPERVAGHYLGELRRAGVDTVILGCTHYPLLASVIGSVLGPGITLVDSADETARHLQSLLTDRSLLSPSTSRGELVCYASDRVEDLLRFGQRFLGHALDTATFVEQSDTPWYER